MMRVACALIGAFLAGLFAIPSAAATTSSTPSAGFHAYHGHNHVVAPTDTRTERGPPAGHDYFATHNAVDVLSHDALTRTNGLTSPAIHDYNHPSSLVWAVWTATTTEGPARRPDGELSSFGREGVAANTLPKALTVGKNADEGVHVYYGVSGGKNVYAGITNNVGRRTTQHADRFTLRPITAEGLTRGQARAVEQALIVRNPGFQNKINSISPTHSWYQDAVDWGETWLVRNGY